LIPFFFHCIRNFEGIISTLLVGVFIPTILENETTAELMKYENNYKALNLITIALGRNVYDRISHLECVHAIWEKLCNTFEGTSEIKSTRKDTYNK
jgi:hypothetical protein